MGTLCMQKGKKNVAKLRLKEIKKVKKCRITQTIGSMRGKMATLVILLDFWDSELNFITFRKLHAAQRMDYDQMVIL